MHERFMGATMQREILREIGENFRAYGGDALDRTVLRVDYPI